MYLSSLPNSNGGTINLQWFASIVESNRVKFSFYFQSPPRGTVVPYRPKPSQSQGLLAGGLQNNLGLSGLDVSFIISLGIFT